SSPLKAYYPFGVPPHVDPGERPMDDTTAPGSPEEPAALPPGFAEDLANATYLNLQEVHRGVATAVPGGVALFGNDDFVGRESTQREGEAVRRGLAEAGAEELAFAVNSVGNPGYTWVLVARPAGPDAEKQLPRRLFDLVWRAWAEAWQVADNDHEAQAYR